MKRGRASFPILVRPSFPFNSVWLQASGPPRDISFSFKVFPLRDYDRSAFFSRWSWDIVYLASRNETAPPSSHNLPPLFFSQSGSPSCSKSGSLSDPPFLLAGYLFLSFPFFRLLDQGHGGSLFSSSHPPVNTPPSLGVTSFCVFEWTFCASLPNGEELFLLFYLPFGPLFLLLGRLYFQGICGWFFLLNVVSQPLSQENPLPFFSTPVFYWSSFPPPLSFKLRGSPKVFVRE